MADHRDTSEGWNVPQRLPVCAAGATVTTLTLLLLASGYLYNHHLRQATYRQPVALPGPGLDTFIHAAARDPEQAAQSPAPSTDVAAAKRRVAAQGLPGWAPQR